MNVQEPPKHHWAYVAVDVVVLTIRDDVLHAMAVRRRDDPGRGRLALPGGFVGLDEDLDDAARRELREETGIEVRHVEQVRTYGTPDRDERARTISVLYLAVQPNLPEGQAGTDAVAAEWVPVDELLEAELPFDHHQMLGDAVERARAKLEYSPIATTFVGPRFTISELRHVYEIVWGRRLDAGNFHRKVTSVEGFLVRTDEHRTRGTGRPSRVYTAGWARSLDPPMSRDRTR